MNAAGLYTPTDELADLEVSGTMSSEAFTHPTITSP